MTRHMDYKSVDYKSVTPDDGHEKGVIIRGGSNIFAEEIESVLLSHPLVRDAAVFGVPDPELGQRVAAVVPTGRRWRRRSNR